MIILNDIRIPSKPMKDNLHYKSATDLITALANKQISSTELLEETISRIEKLDTHINAIPVRDFTQARAAAKAADAAIARGEQKPLLGLPISVKESFNVMGFPTTWGNREYQNWQPSEDALTVHRLKTAGAIIIGKSNVPLMLKDWQAFNDIYGTTNNPWNLSLTSGGSSGGSAAALAAGFVSLELGSDLAGSLRVPAHFCGVYAHKPSQDLIPLRGSSPPTTPPSSNRVDLVVAGPMARTALDLSLGLDILAGPDELLEGKGYKLSLPLPRHSRLNNFRVLILDTHPLCPTSTSTIEALAHLETQLIKAGVEVSRSIDNMPDLVKTTKTYATFLAGFGSADLPIETYTKIGNTVKDLSQDDNSLLSYLLRGTVNSHRDWLLATRTRATLSEQWRLLFKTVDVILCPVTPTPAFIHDHTNPQKRQLKIDESMMPYNVQFIWPSIATLCGLPVTVAPISYASGLPIGIQIIGDYLEDYTTIKFAHLLEREWGGFVIPPL
jgi:amidase